MDGAIGAEWLSAVADWIVAAAASFAAYQGWKGLTAWRLENAGIRRMELAEVILSDFYRARDELNQVRSPFFFLELVKNDGPDRCKATCKEVVRRLDERTNFFSDIQSKKYRVIGLLGDEAAAPFRELDNIVADVKTAAFMLIARPYDTDRANLDIDDKIWLSCVFSQVENDPVAKRLDAVIADVENTFRHYIGHPERL